MPELAVAECYPAGKTTDLHEMSFLDRATLGPGGNYVLVESTRAPTADVFELPAGRRLTISKPSGTLLKFTGEYDLAFESGGKWTAVNLVSHKKRLLNTMEISAQTSAANMANSLPLAATLPIAGGSHIKNVPVFGGLSLLELETDRWLCAEPDARELSVSETTSALQKAADLASRCTRPDRRVGAGQNDRAGDGLSRSSSRHLSAAASLVALTALGCEESMV